VNTLVPGMSSNSASYDVMRPYLSSSGQ
jgi:hypothetical protein